MRHGSCELLCVALLVLSTSAVGQQIRGDYIETRSADVYTGQCFANGEVNLVGDEAILAWHVQSGSWEGVSLDGLTVAAAVHAHAVLFVDDQATPQQSSALVAFAHQMGGELLRHAQRVIPAPMELVVNSE